MKHDKNKPRRPRNAPPRERERPDERPSGSMIFGLMPVIEALKAERRGVDRVMIAEGAQERRFSELVELCRSRGVPLNRIARDNFQRYVGAEANHQGVVAFASAAAYSDIDDVIDASATPLILILDGVEDPRNLGAILRTAECAGVDGVIIPERRAVGLNDTVAKSSAGAVEHIRVAKAANLNRLIEDLKRRNIWVVGTSVDSTRDHTEWDWTQPTAIVLGGEGSGLHRLVAENCDVLVKIPMYGKIGSLNVSVAAGVVLFEARRQRKLNSEE
jgi:23S rRNA (guanosine2251-2'-O)-methyltransferase